MGLIDHSCIGRKQPVAVIAALGLLLCLGFIAYSNSFQAAFQLDDLSNIVNNPSIKHFPDLAEIALFNPPRTITNMTFALNHLFGGLDVIGFHAVNIAIHLANACLVFFFAGLLLKAPAVRERFTENQAFQIAWISALVFVLHPVQIQGVTYLVQRATSLAAFFYLGALLGYGVYRLRQNKKAYVLGLVSASLGMLSKETMVTLPISLCLMEIFFFEAGRKDILRILTRLFPFFATLGLLVAAYMVYWNNFSWAPENLMQLTRETESLSRWEYLFTQFRVMITYLRLLVFPADLKLEYDYPVYRSFSELPVFLSFLCLLAIADFTIRLHRNHRLISYGIALFFLCLLPESSIFPITDVIFEHRLYLPMIGISIAAGTGIVCFVRASWRKGFVISLAVILSTLTYQRNGEWADPITMLQENVQSAPRHGRAYVNLGNYYILENNLHMAVQQYKRALAVEPGNYHAHTNIGIVYYLMGKRRHAVHHFLEALKYHENFAQAHFNLGRMAYEDNRPEEAERYFRRAIEANPEFAYSYVGMAILYADAGNPDRALQMAQTASRLNPDVADIHYQLGNLFYQFGRLEEARDAFQKAVPLDGRFVNALNNLGNVYYAMGDYQAAEIRFQKALEINRDFVSAYFNLANVYHALGDVKKAEDYFGRAKDLARIQQNEEMMDKTRLHDEASGD